jgi:hypothetical protein
MQEKIRTQSLDSNAGKIFGELIAEHVIKMSACALLKDEYTEALASEIGSANGRSTACYTIWMQTNFLN